MKTEILSGVISFKSFTSVFYVTTICIGYDLIRTRLTQTVPMRDHNICFLFKKIRKKSLNHPQKATLTGVLVSVVTIQSEESLELA